MVFACVSMMPVEGIGLEKNVTDVMSTTMVTIVMCIANLLSVSMVCVGRLDVSAMQMRQMDIGLVLIVPVVPVDTMVACALLSVMRALVCMEVAKVMEHVYAMMMMHMATGLV